MTTKINTAETMDDGISINFTLNELTYSEWYQIVNRLVVVISQACEIEEISGVSIGVDTFRLEGAEYNQMGIELKMLRD